jgi:hypothetical protein
MNHSTYGLHTIRANFLGYQGVTTEVWRGDGRRVSARGQLNASVGFVIRMRQEMPGATPSAECVLSWPNGSDLVVYSVAGAVPVGCEFADLLAAAANRQPIRVGFIINAITRQIQIISLFELDNRTATFNLTGTSVLAM